MNILAYSNMQFSMFINFLHVLSFYHLFEWGNRAPEATFCGFLPKWVLQCYKNIKLQITSVKMCQIFQYLYFPT